jgi:polyferredoxin
MVKTMGLEHKKINFDLREYLTIALIIILFGSFATSWNFANNRNLTPESTFGQVWASTLMYLVYIGIIFIIGAAYYAFKNRDD